MKKVLLKENKIKRERKTIIYHHMKKVLLKENKIKRERKEIQTNMED